MTSDQLRTAALIGSCAGFIAVPNLGVLVGHGEKTEQYDTPITPPGYAFTIWGPIFAACAADTIRRCRRQDSRHPTDKSTVWPLAGAYAANTAWSLAAQTDRFALTPALLPTATGLTALAYRRLQHPTNPPAGSTSLAAGLLLGWTALASTVNLAADAVRRGADPHSRRTVTACTAALALTSAALTGTVAVSRQGHTALTAAACWGLATTAADRRRPALVRATAGAATTALALAATIRRVRPRRLRPTRARSIPE